MGRAIYRENTHPTAVQAVVHLLPKGRRSRPSTGCPLPGRPINRSCPIVLCLAAMALDMPITCLLLTEGKAACPPFYLQTILPDDMLCSCNSTFISFRNLYWCWSFSALFILSPARDVYHPLRQLVGLPSECTEHQEKALRRGDDDYQTESQQW